MKEGGDDCSPPPCGLPVRTRWYFVGQYVHGHLFGRSQYDQKSAHRPVEHLKRELHQVAVGGCPVLTLLHVVGDDDVACRRVRAAVDIERKRGSLTLAKRLGPDHTVATIDRRATGGILLLREFGVAVPLQGRHGRRDLTLHQHDLIPLLPLFRGLAGVPAGSSFVEPPQHLVGAHVTPIGRY